MILSLIRASSGVSHIVGPWGTARSELRLSSQSGGLIGIQHMDPREQAGELRAALGIDGRLRCTVQHRTNEPALLVRETQNRIHGHAGDQLTPALLHHARLGRRPRMQAYAKVHWRLGARTPDRPTLRSATSDSRASLSSRASRPSTTTPG